MPILTAAILADGALVDIRVGWSTARVRALRRALQPIPQSVDLRALIDSGAASSCIDESVVRQLGLPLGSFGLANLPASGGLLPAPEHDVDLIVLHSSGDPREDLGLLDLRIIELPIGALGYQALIGRDVLNGCRFLYDGPQGSFSLEW